MEQPKTNLRNFNNGIASDILYLGLDSWQNNTYHKILNKSPGLVGVCKHLLEDLSKHRRSIDALPMFIDYPNFAHIIPNACPKLTFGEAHRILDTKHYEQKRHR